MSAQEAEFVEYLESIKPLILKVVRIYCFDTEEQKDLFQEIVIQLWRAFPRYDNQYAITTWTYRIALNVSISYIRKTTTRKKQTSSYTQQSDLLQLEYNYELDKDLERLYKVINHLGELEKAIITLQLEGMKNKEIAEIVGITPSNVSTRLHRIKEKIKANLIKQK